MKSRVEVTVDLSDKVNDIIRKFKNDAVLVGIPESKTKRKDDEPINNATIMAINEFGSAANNIPARPVMSIGIRNAQNEISDQFKLAAQNVFSKGFEALNTYYNRAGIIASNAIKKAINSQIGFDAPSEATLRAREAMGFKGTKALIVTGQLRNSVTYVLNEGVF